MDKPDQPITSKLASRKEAQSEQFYCNTKCDMGIKIRNRHSPPSRVEVTNEWLHTPPSLYALMVLTGNTLLFNQDMLNYNSVILTIC
jgi:hypothetical protein